MSTQATDTARFEAASLVVGSQQSNNLPPLGPIEVREYLKQAEELADTVLQECRAGSGRTDPVIGGAGWRATCQSAQQKVSELLAVASQRGIETTAGDMVEKVNQKLRHVLQLAEHHEQMQTAMTRLCLGQGTTEDVQTVLAEVGTPAERRQAWASLTGPTSPEALLQFSTNMLQLALADRPTARQARHFFRAIGATSVSRHSEWIGADLTFQLAGQPGRIRDRLVGVKWDVNGDEYLLFENYGAQKADQLPFCRPSVATLPIEFGTLQEDITAHNEILASFTPEERAQFEQLIIDARQALIRQRERLGMPAELPQILILLAELPPGYWGHAVSTLGDKSTDPVQDHVRLSKDFHSIPPEVQVELLVHEMNHILGTRYWLLHGANGLDERHRLEGTGSGTVVWTDNGQPMDSQLKRVGKLLSRNGDVYYTGRAPPPSRMSELINKGSLGGDGEWPNEYRLEAVAQSDGIGTTLKTTGRWTEEYLVDFLAVLAVDPTLGFLSKYNHTAYRPGVLALASACLLTPESERLELERALAKAQLGSRNDLIGFASRYLTPNELTFFRHNYELVLADPGLGGLIDALARQNPLTQNIAGLLFGPRLDMSWTEWDRQLTEQLEAIQPVWLRATLEAVANDRTTQLRERVAPEGVFDIWNSTDFDPRVTDISQVMPRILLNGVISRYGLSGGETGVYVDIGVGQPQFVRQSDEFTRAHRTSKIPRVGEPVKVAAKTVNPNTGACEFEIVDRHRATRAPEATEPPPAPDGQ